MEAYRFTGNTVVSDEELESLAAPFTNRRVSPEDLQALRDEITRLYVSRGYVNSGATIPDQRVDEGVVEYRITEGVLGEIEISGNEYFRTSYLRRRLELGAGEPLDVRSLEEQLQILQEDHRIGRVKAELEPGALPGEARLRVDVDDVRPWHAWLEASNHQAPSIGAERGRLTLAHENLTGNGDVLSVAFALTNGLRDLDASYEVPITARDTLLRFWYRRSNSDIVEQPFKDLDIESETRTYGVGIEHPFLRTQSTTFTMGLDAEYRRSATSLLGRPFSFAAGVQDGVSRVAVLRFHQQWVRRSRAQVLAFRSTVSWGLDALGATVNKNSVPDGQFVTWLGQLQWVRRWPGGIESIFRVDGQVSSDPLLSLEQYAVGGHASVRGYRENRIVRDQGVVGSLELRIPLISSRDGSSRLQLAPFVDAGHTRSRHRGPTPHPRTLVSAGVGLRFAITRRIHGEIYWAEELRDLVEPVDRNLQDTGVHFRLTVQLF